MAFPPGLPPMQDVKMGKTPMNTGKKPAGRKFSKKGGRGGGRNK